MFGKLLNSVTWQVRADLRRKLKANRDHKNLSWNLAERLQVYCSTHYIRAMLILWGVAAGAVAVAHYARPVFDPFARQHFKGITALPGWMSSLLGSQVTLIGIVFPLVVGLISVLFQKKSSRIHIQSAYQLNSGYMFAGLSALSLAGFILMAGIASSLGDNYLNTAIAVTAFIWMLFNIFLSIWFFVTSLNVLDDDKRDRLMKKYYQSQMVSQYIQQSMIRSWLQYPGHYIGNQYLKTIKILPYADAMNDGMNTLTCPVKKNEIVKDIYLRPLLFLLRRLRPVSDQEAEIVILPSSGRENGNLTLLSAKGVITSQLWNWLYRRCIPTGIPRQKKDYNDIPYDFFGEAYDALNDKNIGIFKMAVKRLTGTYTSVKRSFCYADGNFLDEQDASGLSYSLSQSFHFELRQFIRETVKSTETTGAYFSEAMYVPLHVYRESDSTSFTDFRQFIQSLFSVWHTLTEWKAGNGGTLSVSQEQTHQDLIRSFISLWEGWSMGDVIGKPDAGDYASRLLFHLHYTVRLIIPPVVADNVSSARHAHDVLCLWNEKSRFSRYWEEEFRWHSFFLNPDYINLEPSGPQWTTMLRGGTYNEKAASAIIFSNALCDMRLLISGYIVANLEPQGNIDLADLVNRLGLSSLFEERDDNDAATPAFKTATDIIDIILRIEHYRPQNHDNWYGALSETIEALTSFNERPLISGRVYSGIKDDLDSLYGAFALLAIRLARTSEPVTERVSEALAGGLFSYFRKEQIIHTLERLKRDPFVPYQGYMLSADEYAGQVPFFNGILDRYIEAFSRSRTADILAAEVDTERLRKTDIRLTAELPGALSEDPLLARFNFTADPDFRHDWQMRCYSAGVPREYVARHLNTNFYGDFPATADLKGSMLHRLHFMLGKLPSTLNTPVSNLPDLLQAVRQHTADQRDSVLIIYGSRFSDELRELSYQPDRHAALNLQIDTPVRGVHGLPVRINNCLIYQVRHALQNYSLLVNRETFGELKLFRYPDGTLFNTFYRSSADPLEGELRTVWEFDMQVKGPLAGRFDHL